MGESESNSTPMPARARKVLLVVHTNTFFVELEQLAKALEKDAAFRPEVMLYPYPTAGWDAQQCKAAGIPCIDQSGSDFIVRDPRLSRAGQAVSRLNSLLRRSSFYDLGYELISMAWRRRRIGQILRRRMIDLVVLGGDMVGYDTAAVIDASHRHGIPVGIVPSTMSNGLEQAEIYFDNPRHGMRSWLSRHVGRRYPNWLYRHKGRELLRESGARALAMEWLGLAPPLPWIFNSGKADAVMVESAAMLDYYRVAGLSAEPLTVTGSPSDDAIAGILSDTTRRKQELCARLGLAPERPILLTALPPDFLYVKGGRPQCDFQNYGDLVRFWIDSIGAVSGFNKVICLHPSVDPDSMRSLETSDMRLARARTAELVPLCDVYVASVSSTIRWAIACAKPVINYDVYRYRYTDYLGLKGVITIEEQSQFLDVLRRMTSDAAFRNEIAERQEAEAPQWGNFDGKARQRIAALLHELIGENRH